MPLPPFEPSGDVPEGLHQADVAEFLARFGSGTPQRARVAARLLQAFGLIRPLGVISRVIVGGSFITAQPEPADADILWVTLPIFDRHRLPVQVDVLLDCGETPVWDRRPVDSRRFGVSRYAARRPLGDQGMHQAGAGGGAMVMQNDSAFQATQYRLAQFEKVVCGLRHELSPQAFAACVPGYMLDMQRMREEIDAYLLRPLQAPAPALDAAL